MGTSLTSGTVTKERVGKDNGGGERRRLQERFLKTGIINNQTGPADKINSAAHGPHATIFSVLAASVHRLQLPGSAQNILIGIYGPSMQCYLCFCDCQCHGDCF